MGAELERLAQLTSKIKSRGEYLSRMRRVIGFTHNMALALPLTREEHAVQTAGTGQGLFIPEIPDLPYSLVPNSIVGWRDRIQAFVREHPFDKSVFIMIRYRKNNNRLIDALKEELSKHGCNGIVASDHNLTKDLYNPVACLLACSKGIAVFDAPGKGPQFNPNVAYELGMLHLLGRECLILKHSTLKSLHADILMKLYTGYRTAKDARCHVAEWLQEGHDRPVE
jgi:hypothetical protein